MTKQAAGPTVVPDDITPEMLAETEKDIKAILHLEKERGETNADIDAIRKRIYARGITSAALTASIARYKMDTDQRQAFDKSRAIVDKALGIPVQGDLFGTDAGGRPSKTADTSKAGQAEATVQ